MGFTDVVILYQPDNIYSNKRKYIDEVDQMDELGLIMIYRAYIEYTQNVCAPELSEDDLFKIDDMDQIKYSNLISCTRKFLKDSIRDVFDPQNIMIFDYLIQYKIMNCTYLIFTHSPTVSGNELYRRACALSHMRSFNQTIERVDPPFL